MSQVGSTRDKPHASLRSDRLKEIQSRSVALVLRIAWPLTDIEAMNKQSLADICRIILSV
jgi:hypothetical protein